MGLGAHLATMFSLCCDPKKLGSISRCQNFPDLLLSLLCTVGMALMALGIGNSSFSYPSAWWLWVTCRQRLNFLVVSLLCIRWEHQFCADLGGN